MKLLCTIIGHHRSGRRARHDPVFEWRSVCQLCGQRMVRIAPGNWVLESEARAPEEKAST